MDTPREDLERQDESQVEKQDRSVLDDADVNNNEGSDDLEETE